MFRPESCPLCGAQGKPMNLTVKNMEKSAAEEARNCLSCGTVFNRFGVIFTLDEEKGGGLELN